MANTEYTHMFKPIKIGSLELKNRLAMAPVTTNYTQAGYPNEQFIAFLAARAKGGVGLLVTPPAVNLFPGSPTHVVFPLLSEKAHISMWNEVVEAIHAFGAKAFCQVIDFLNDIFYGNGPDVFVVCTFNDSHHLVGPLHSVKGIGNRHSRWQYKRLAHVVSRR